MAGRAQAAPRGTGIAALFCAALALLVPFLSPSRAAAGPGGVGAQSCGPQPAGLSPEGPAPSRFTILIRINQQANVDTYSNFDSATGGLGGYVRRQDIFVINTRFETTTPSVATTLANNLAAAFPCNRIIALNGMSLNPLAPGYALSLFDHPSVFALMTDFEPSDWNGGRSTDPGRPPWNQKYKVALPRIKAWNARLAGTLASNPLSAAKRSGLVPLDDASWNYGEVAQNLDKKNRRLGGRHLGPLSVQTQDSCANSGPTGLSNRAKQILDTYKYRFVRKVVKRKGKKRKITVRRKLKPAGRPSLSNMSLQISFSDTPNPNAGMAITKTSAATAAACARAGLKRGGGAFFFFASHDSMRLLFQQPQIASLRPPTS
ncbi:MAG TPA: hypothetical protein VHH72_00020 [Solirubrobacterales bacterium]|jgi:hypothetical protein|nr:hypothetical protein [Solirubrobacterales bacterium]